MNDQTLSAAQQDTAEWYAEPMSIASSVDTLVSSGYTPAQIKTAYNLPAYGGEGVTIAIIIAFHTPNIKNYLSIFSQTYGLPLPTDSNFEVHKMTSYIETNVNWTLEACLDVEWAHAIAPNATILLVEALSNEGSDLLDAIDYATSRGDVDVISMSWGSKEFHGETDYNAFFDSSEIGFFAASGDTGSVVMWPSVCPNVVSVGGTSLSLDSNGQLISENAWSGSGGGVSAYETIPDYQRDYGLSGSYRTTPDVSYSAGTGSKGVNVYYNSAWYSVGGTSAGAPQWAAIYALGLSASHENLYYKASTGYSTHFRDITSGSTTKYSTSIGYDYVTGLGSPLKYNFSKSLDVSPLRGNAGANVTLTGNGISGSTLSISFLNSITDNWVDIVNSTTLTDGTFAFNTTISDLMQSSPAGDNTPSYDSIVFQATNDLGASYYTTVPFKEFRRGLTQVGTETADGMYGNNTDFGTNLYIQNGDILPVSGQWFSSGNGTILWDNATLGIVNIDETGAFSTSLRVPQSNAGEHTLAIQDSATLFIINVTVSPLVSADYSRAWENSDFQITLSNDTTIDEIYYRINNGEVQNVTANGQPTITTQSANNTLEYWCNWTLNGATLETAHENLIGIKLDKTAPTGSIVSNPTTSSRTITLHLSADDSLSGVSEMQFSSDEVIWSSWETYDTSTSWTLTSGDGVKAVYVQFKNGAGLTYKTMCTVTLETPHETVAPQMTTKATKTPAPTATSTTSPAPTPSTIPEFPFGVALSVLVFASLLLLLLAKKQAIYKSK